VFFTLAISAENPARCAALTDRARIADPAVLPVPGPAAVVWRSPDGRAALLHWGLPHWGLPHWGLPHWGREPGGTDAGALELADSLAHALQFQRHLLVCRHNLIEVIGDLAREPRPGHRQAHAEIAILHRLQALQNCRHVLRGIIVGSAVGGGG